MPDVQPGQLVFFADDWGRHPSSAQHIVRHLLPRHRALWVNTIGTRAPRLRLEDAGKVASKLYRWLAPRRESVELPANLKVVHPKMYPGFRAPWQRAVNRASMTNAISRALRDWPAAPRVAVTTLPVTADLIGAFDVDRWVYYCVDDFSVWPGIDEAVMEAMERDLLAKVDRVIVVSDTLRERVASMVEDVLLSEQCRDRGIFQPDGLSSVVASHLAGKANATYLIMALLIIELGQRHLHNEGGFSAKPS